MKVLNKIILFTLVFVLMSSFYNNFVHATNSFFKEEDFIVKDTIIEGIIDKFKYDNSNISTENVNVIISTEKMYSLFNNKDLLKENLKNDNFVYENFYIKMPEEADSATLDNLYENDKKMEVINIGEERYVKCEFTLAQLYNGEYYCAFLTSDGMNLNSGAKMQTWGNVSFKDKNNNEITKLRWDVTEDYDLIDSGKLETGVILLKSNISDKYELGGAGGDGAYGFSYDRKSAKGDCYVEFYTNSNLGNTVNIKPFGKLNYVGKGNPFGEGTDFEKYSLKIEDKLILNQNYILTEFDSQNGITFCKWSMFGDLIKIEKENKQTSIKLVADENVIPKDTVLETTVVSDKKVLNIVKESLKNISTIYVTYDISLKNNNVAIQPNGNVKISIPIPKNFNKNKVVVYSISQNGDKTKHNVIVEGDYATIETSHFSTYVLAENNITESQNDNKEQEIKIEVWKNPFNDVKTTDWFYSAVEYTNENKLIAGYNANTFAPNDKLTRAMMVTILYRMDGAQKNDGKSKFSDVKNTEWYSQSIKWAVDNGIVHGYSGTNNFGPNDNIIRQDLAGILRNYAVYKKKNGSTSGDITKFKDYKTVSDYAITSIKWAVGAGVITGNSDGTLNPKGNATRAEAAAMIQKYCNKVGK